MAPVQASDVLRDPPAPRDGQREEERVEARVIEALAEIGARGQQDARCRVRNRLQPLAHALQFALPHSAAQHDDVLDLVPKHRFEDLQMRPPLRQHHGRAPLLDGGQHVGHNRLVARLVRDDFVDERGQHGPAGGIGCGV